MKKSTFSRALAVFAASVFATGALTFATVTPAIAGVLDTEIRDGQAFAVQRSPAYPTCSVSGGTFNSFSLTQMERPYSTPAGQNTADMGTDYLKLLPSGDTSHPWRLGRFNAAGEELRYDAPSTSWVDSTSPAYAGGDQWDDAGIVLALYEDGYFYESYPNGYGLYVSLVTTYNLGDGETYTPTSEFNDCVFLSAYGQEVAVAKSTAIDTGDSGGGDGGEGDDGSGSPAAEPTMPDTGASVRTVVIVSVSAAVVFAFALFVYASRRKLRFAWTNDRVASLMDDLNARLSAMEQRAKAAAARRRLRK
jgi:hypothetical protein